MAGGEDGELDELDWNLVMVRSVFAVATVRFNAMSESMVDWRIGREEEEQVERLTWSWINALRICRDNTTIKEISIDTAVYGCNACIDEDSIPWI